MQHRGRVTVRMALIAIAGVGLALAALRGATALWWLATLVVTMGLVMWATVGAIILRAPDRGPWLGIALFGGVLFLMIHSFTIFPNFRGNMYASLDYLADVVHPDPVSPPVDPVASVEEQQRQTEVNNAKTARSTYLRDNFTSILLLLLNVAFALLGGLAGRSFAARIPTTPPPASPIGYNGEKAAP